MTHPPEEKHEASSLAAQRLAVVHTETFHLSPETTDDAFGAAEIESVFEDCAALTGNRPDAAPLSASSAAPPPDSNSWDAQIARKFRTAGFTPTARSSGDDVGASPRSAQLDQGLAVLMAVLDTAEDVGNQRGAASLDDTLLSLAALLYLLQRPCVHGLTAKACATKADRAEPAFHRRVQRWSELTGIPAPGGRSTVQRSRISAGLKHAAEIENREAA